MAAPIRFTLAGRCFAAALALSASLLGAENKSAADKGGYPPAYNIHLWEPGKVPMAKGDGPLDNPFLTVFQPPEGKRNGGAVVIAPGGSNIMLMYGAEGIDIAERYNDWGVTAFVLTYRMSPHYNDAARALDGNRALQIVRSRASEFKVDPAKVGYIGFSAGSNMGRLVVNASTAGDAGSADPVSRLNSRPDYLVLVYGPGRATPGENLKNFPPTFLMCAEGDTGNAVGSAQLFQDLARAGAVAEIHVYQKGHHGFGDGFAAAPYNDWMGRLEIFLKQGAFIPGGRD